MFREPSSTQELRAGLSLVASRFSCFALLKPGYAWGNNAQRLIINHAIDTLPYDVRGFFESNRSYFIQHVNDTLEPGRQESRRAQQSFH